MRRSNNWRLLLLSLFVFFILPASAQQLSKPKLVVTLVVDPLSPQWIDKYNQHFGEGGILKLLNQGYEFRNASTGQFLANRASSIYSHPALQDQDHRETLLGQQSLLTLQFLPQFFRQSIIL